jgi:hypothetical protein
MLQSRVEQDGKRVTKCNFVSLIGPYIQLLQVRANQQYKYWNTLKNVSGKSYTS